MAKHSAIVKLGKMALWPSEKISECVSKVIPHQKRDGKIAVGVALMIGGAQMASIYPAGCLIPHCVYDACAWFIHACGTAPIMEAYCDRKRKRKQEKANKKITKNARSISGNVQ